MEVTCTICKHYSRTMEQHDRHIQSEAHKTNAEIYEMGLEAGEFKSAATIARLRDALKPFSHPDLSRELGGNVKGDESPVFQRGAAILKLKHFRAIRRELSRSGSESEE